MASGEVDCFQVKLPDRRLRAEEGLGSAVYLRSSFWGDQRPWFVGRGSWSIEGALASGTSTEVRSPSSEDPDERLLIPKEVASGRCSFRALERGTRGGIEKLVQMGEKRRQGDSDKFLAIRWRWGQAQKQRASLGLMRTACSIRLCEVASTKECQSRMCSGQIPGQSWRCM